MRLIERNTARVLPTGTPVSGKAMTVEVQRKGYGANIKFAAEDNLVDDVESMPTVVKIEYADGYATVSLERRSGTSKQRESGRSKGLRR
jgi:hypothetical protein